MMGLSSVQIFLLILPILVLELVLTLIALRDLLSLDRRVRGDSKALWVLVILMVSGLGPILYLTVGRKNV